MVRADHISKEQLSMAKFEKHPVLVIHLAREGRPLTDSFMLSPGRALSRLQAFAVLSQGLTVEARCNRFIQGRPSKGSWQPLKPEDSIPYNADFRVPEDR